MNARFERIAATALRAAESKAENAAREGQHHDHGASRIRNIVEAWNAGLAGKVPPLLEHYAKIADQEADPEWSEFQRLQRKFG